MWNIGMMVIRAKGAGDAAVREKKIRKTKEDAGANEDEVFDNGEYQLIVYVKERNRQVSRKGRLHLE